MRVVTRCTFASLLASLVLTGTAWGDSPLRSLLSFRDRVEADATKEYMIAGDEGPWMILAASFSGETAREDANQLILELRKEFNLEAYLWAKDFNFTDPVQARGVDRYGRPVRARHAQAVEFTEWAVLVGGYESIESRDLERDMEKVKAIQPAALDIENGEGQTLRYGGIKSWYSTMTGNPERGPMASAFAVHNPAVPEEYFTQPGLDPLVVQMNEQVEHSLLTCPGKYTVQVAVFRGRNTIQQEAIPEIEAGRLNFESRLVEAAEKAHLMVEALRAQGVPAFEYHDLEQSSVCVGSFDLLYELDPERPYVLDDVGRQWPNPAVDAQNRPKVHPDILRTVAGYGPAQRTLPDGRRILGSEPRTIQVNDGNRVRTLSFDIAPIPVVVPKQEFGDAYAQESDGGFFRR